MHNLDNSCLEKILNYTCSYADLMNFSLVNQNWLAIMKKLFPEGKADIYMRKIYNSYIATSDWDFKSISRIEIHHANEMSAWNYKNYTVNSLNK